MLSNTELSAVELQQAAQRIKSLRRAATEHAVEIGRELLRIKERLPHGTFVKWVEKSCDFKIRAAQDLMKLAREVESDARLVALMVPSTLRVYLSKTTPADVRRKILKRLESGEQVSRSELYSEASVVKSRTKSQRIGRSKQEDPADLLFEGPDLLRAEEGQGDLGGDRSRMVADLIIRRLSRKDYEFIMEGMDWGVWNRILIWMRAARIVDSDRVELIQANTATTPTLVAIHEKLQ